MKILSLSLDKKVLDKNSAVAKRLQCYGGQVEKLLVIVPNDESVTVNLSERVTVLGTGGFAKPSQLIKLMAVSREQMKQDSFDLVTVQDPYYLGLAGVAVARFYNLPLEIQVHGFEKLSGGRKLLAKYVLRSADGIRTVSERLRRQIMADFSISADKIYSIPVQSDLASIKPELKLTRTDDKFVLLTVARLVPVKNIGAQLRVLVRLKQNYPKLELWVVGAGPEQKRLQDLAEALGVFSLVRWLGWQNDLSKFYREADIFLITSDSEGWGMVAVEAAAWGLPIIMTDVGLAGEVIKNEESGLVVPVGDEGALFWAVRRLIEDEAGRKKLGQKAAAVARHLPKLADTARMMVERWGSLVRKTKSI